MLPETWIMFAQGETDGFGRILIGLLFLVIWIVVQVIAAAGARKKKQEARERQMGRPNRPAERPRQAPAQAQAQRPSGELSYDEIRRRLQAQQQADRTQPARNQPVRVQPQQPVRQPQHFQQRPQRAPQEAQRPQQRKQPPHFIAPPAPTADTTPSIFEEEIATGRVIGTAEIGSRAAGPEAAWDLRQRKARSRRIDDLLEPRRLADAIVAMEILRPPLALREEQQI